MTQPATLAVFGEVLFDCFADGEQTLGGAPFNVAWHLQALGDKPLFISRVGNDALGDQVRKAMQGWQLSTQGLQLDNDRATGTVNVSLTAGQPAYDIASESAYDFIQQTELPTLRNDALLYHGSLALRHPVSRAALAFLTRPRSISVFMDVNLRSPWWEKEDVYLALERARWCKLNEDELIALGFNSADLQQDMTRMQSHFQLEQLIVTCGEKGAVVRCNDGQFFEQKATSAGRLVDTVGAGDAFSAMYIHGLLARWPVQKILRHAQQFASKVIELRGAITDEADFYQAFR